jgi:hypothetical protein
VPFTSLRERPAPPVSAAIFAMPKSVNFTLPS